MEMCLFPDYNCEHILSLHKRKITVILAIYFTTFLGGN